VRGNWPGGARDGPLRVGQLLGRVAARSIPAGRNFFLSLA